MTYKILTIINLILLAYILFRMKDYNKLVKEKNKQDLLEEKKRQQESWKEIVKFFGSEEEAEKHYEREFLDDLEQAYKYHIEHGTKPIEGFDEWMKKAYSKLNDSNNKPTV